MACCGNKRAQLPARLATSSARPMPHRDDAPRPIRVFFEYTGRTGLTTTGPASGRRYRFDAPGARQEVDPRDRSALATVPHLRQVS